MYYNYKVYSLCGTLPEGIKEMNVSSSTYVQEYPNPSSGEAEFKFQLPSNFENYELQIYDAAGHSINIFKISGTTTKFSMEENKILQTGKFIINK